MLDRIEQASLSQDRDWKSAHEGFRSGAWSAAIDVRDFIQSNLSPYHGDARFLQGATARTEALWARLTELFAREREKGVLDVSQVPSSITAHGPGYISQGDELIVGLQTDAPLKRAVFPKGGYRMVEGALLAYGYAVDPLLSEVFTKYRKTHNDGVFDVYPGDVRKARSSHLITGLPDAYGRGRIIGDYRRVALYGVDRLLEKKAQELASLDQYRSSEDIIRDREELAEQIRSLRELVTMAQGYGYDLSRPAQTAQEAVQWVYFGYLAATKEQNGAAMSLGRTATFLDIYIQRDLDRGLIGEQQAQELIDDLVIKLRIIRFLRTPEYDALFSGDPTWVTEALGGMSEDGRTLVTKTSFRFLQTLYNLGPAPEPNLTVLWSERLPTGFKEFCARVSLETSSIQYESDALLRGYSGDDTSIACCVSAMETGKQMQFFGARVNLGKCLLYGINGGRDEVSGKQVMPAFKPVEGDVLQLDDVIERFEVAMDWLAATYVDAMNCIHYMHDKYAYESFAMALHDYNPQRTMAFGIAGLSVVADSLAAICYGEVKVVRNDDGLIVDYESSGELPRYGNNDDRADRFARYACEAFMERLRRQKTYRNAEHTQSVLTITSNVVYGKATGSTPDGRKAGEPFAPGANPLHGRDQDGVLASAFSVAQLPYEACRDGISYTATLLPNALGAVAGERAGNLAGALDAMFDAGLFHVNVNVLSPQVLRDAMAHPENYPQLTVRVSGYAVNFVKLTREQQLEILARTFHERP